MSAVNLILCNQISGMEHNFFCVIFAPVINYKDSDDAAEKFLAELGDPYTLIGADRSGRVGIDWGVYGVPETFVIDGKGSIVYKHIGPIQGTDIAEKILPAVEKAKGGS